MDFPKPSRKSRPSKAVVERKKNARRIKYNAIGVARQQARIATVNVIQVDGDDVDMSDAFDFMTWYLSNVEECANAGGPVPESIIIQFRDNLLALDLSGSSRREKVEFVMDVVRAPELKDVCSSLLDEEVEVAVDAVEEVPLIDLSDTSDHFEGELPTATVVEEIPQSIGTTPPVRIENTPKEIYRKDTAQFIDMSLQENICPILTLDESWRHYSNEYEKPGVENTSHYVVNWNLHVFRRLFIQDDRYNDWLYELQQDKSVLQNVKWKSEATESQHYFKTVFAKLVDIPINLRYDMFGFAMVSSGLSIITTGENGCQFIGL